jgi:lipopolysaccharide/colanic/teichoic acid biosynthesis glycosyltransferase
LNVLAGQMSLVGPRPSLPGEVARYPRSWLRRFGVKPGLSGLWQVSGRSAVPPRRRMAIDRRYLRDRSLALDLAIMLRTVSAILSRRGAW